MTSYRRQFHAQAVPTIIMVILAPLFVGLGVWQLDRAEQKRNQGASLEMRRKQPSLSLDGPLPEAKYLRFRQVLIRGRYLNDKSVLIENRKHQGKTGFHLITPVVLHESEVIVLINRGWIAHDQLDHDLATADVQGTVSLQGEIRIPQPPAIELELQDSSVIDELPHWPYLTLEHYSEWSGFDVLPFIVLLSPQAKYGFIRQWPHPRVSDLMHIGYAIQWFAFALITLLVWLRLSLHKTAATEAGS